MRQRASERQGVRASVCRTAALPHCRAGFTMVELVVAAAIAAIVLVGVAVTTGGGILAWRRAEELARLAREGTTLIRTLESQLLRSLASDTFPFEGQKTGLQFVMSDGRGPVAVRWTPTTYTPQYGRVEALAFAFPMAQAQPGYAWSEEWTAANRPQVPSAVRVAVQLRGPRGGIWAVQRTIALPHGTFGTMEQGAA